MRLRGPTRRMLLRRALAAAAAGAGFYLVREQLVWPTPRVSFARGAWSGWIDMPVPGGLIELPAEVGGEPVRAVIDSGAQYSAIDGGLAERLALPAATPIPMVAFGVSGSPSLTRAVTLEADLGAFRLQGLRAATLELQPLSGLTRQPFGLLLGRDVLRAVTLEADFPGARAAFFRPDAWRPPPDAAPAVVRVQNGALMIAVNIEQAPPVEVLLDTGATGPLALSETAARGAGLMDGRPMRRGESVTLGGVSEDGMVTARQVAFAGHSLKDVEVQVYRPAANAPVPAGLLGLGVLRRFHVALDHANGRVFLMDGQAKPQGLPGRRVFTPDIIVQPS